MVNPFTEINWKPGSKDLRKFAISLIIGFPCIALLFMLLKWWKTGIAPQGNGGPMFLGGIGMWVGITCYYIHSIARPLYYVWYFLAACIGIVVANLIFVVLFYGVFAPFGLVMRLLGRDPLQLRAPKKDATTYWQDAEPAPPASHYFNQY